MKFKWVIESGIFGYDFEVSLIKALEKNNTGVYIGDYKNIQKDAYLFGNRHIFYGSVNTSFLLSNTSIQVWNKGIDCNKYYPLIDKNKLLNGHYVITTYCDLIRNYEWYISLFNSDKLFVRPNSGLKQFTGFVADKDHLESELRRIHMFPEELVLISKYKNISNEWRLVVCGPEDEQKVVAASQYIKNKEIVESPGSDMEFNVVLFANNIIKKIPTAIYPAWTMDVCDGPNGLSVLEINSFSTAGLYGCDLNVVVKEVNDALESYL